MNLQTFEEKLAYGEEGEEIVAQHLIKEFWDVIPLYQYETKDNAPSLFSINKKTILPDLQVFNKDTNLLWVEVKRKRQWVKWEDGGLETGLNQRHAEDYLKIEEMTKSPVFIFFIHEQEQPNGIYYIKLKTAYKNARFWNGKNKFGEYKSQPMVFFKKSDLKIYKEG